MENQNKLVTIKKNRQVAPAQFNAEALISQGIEKGMSVETLERLLNMRRELKAEWAKEQYDKAMAKFQSECPVIKKTKQVKTKEGGTAYKYAPIESIVDQVKDLIQKNGFSYSTRMELKDKGVLAIVTVKHSAGHHEESPMEVPLGNKTQVMSDSQVVAAAQTFAKRYAFCNAFGILTGDEDNDAKNTRVDNSQKVLNTDDQNKANFEKVMKMINACKNTDVLIDYSEKLKSSKNFNPNQIKVLNGLINSKIDEINNK